MISKFQMNVITSVSRSVDFFFNASSCFCVSSNLTLLSFIFFSSLLADSNSLLTFASSSWLFFESALLAVSCKYINSVAKFKPSNNHVHRVYVYPVFFAKMTNERFITDNLNVTHLTLCWSRVVYTETTFRTTVNYRSTQQNSMY